MPATNKVFYGLSNVYYSKITETEGAITYATPVAITGAVNLALSPVGESTPFYADNKEYHNIVTNNGYEGDLEMALIPDDFRTAILGETVVDGVQVENSAVTPAKLALLFQFEGDVHNKRHVLYYCQCARPNLESSTKAESAEVKTQSLTIIAKPYIILLVKG